MHISPVETNQVWLNSLYCSICVSISTSSLAHCHHVYYLYFGKRDDVSQGSHPGKQPLKKVCKQLDLHPHIITLTHYLLTTYIFSVIFNKDTSFRFETDHIKVSLEIMVGVCQNPKIFGVKTSWLHQWELLTLNHPYYFISIHRKWTYKGITKLTDLLPHDFFYAQSPTNVSCPSYQSSSLARLFQTLIILICSFSYRQHRSVNSRLSSCCTEVRVIVLIVQTLWHAHNFTVLSHPLTSVRWLKIIKFSMYGSICWPGAYSSHSHYLSMLYVLVSFIVFFFLKFHRWVRT